MNGIHWDHPIQGFTCYWHGGEGKGLTGHGLMVYPEASRVDCEEGSMESGRRVGQWIVKYKNEPWRSVEYTASRQGVIDGTVLPSPSAPPPSQRPTPPRPSGCPRLPARASSSCFRPPPRPPPFLRPCFALSIGSPPTLSPGRDALTPLSPAAQEVSAQEAKAVRARHPQARHRRGAAEAGEDEGPLVFVRACYIRAT
jgi:hypothetical protein